MGSAPYYTDEAVTLYHGDCREITEWLAADVLVTDPPYGRGWKHGAVNAAPGRSKGTHTTKHDGIANDQDTSARDAALAMWGAGPAVVFGDLMLAPPDGTKLVGVYHKPPDSGFFGAVGGFRRDVEGIYLLGSWPASLGGQRSSVLATAAPVQGSPNGLASRYGHPHAKPLDVMERILAACPAGVIAEPFAGGGSTLEAARRQGRRAIGVEIDEQYCELIAKRMSQGVLDVAL